MALKDFMILKNKLLKKYGARYDLTDESDIKELEELPIKIVEGIIFYIKEALEDVDNEYIVPADFCPWCIINPDDCSECTYGKRHCNCNHKNSRFSEISSSLDRDIEDIIWKHKEECLEALLK